MNRKFHLECCKTPAEGKLLKHGLASLCGRRPSAKTEVRA